MSSIAIRIAGIVAAAVVLVLMSAAPMCAATDITNVQATVDKRENAGTGHKESWVVIDYDIADVPSDGVVLSMKVELTNKDNGRKITMTPPVKYISGDYGSIQSDGSKHIEWNAEQNLVDENNQGKYDAKVTLQLAGTGDPTEATLSISSYQEDGWQYFSPGTARLTNLQRTDGYQPVCSPTQGNNWNLEVPSDAVFYTGTLTSFPTYNGRRTGDPIQGTPQAGTGCSTFLAIEKIGTPQQKIWVLFAQTWNMVLTSNNTAFKWEFQARYVSDSASQTLVLGNAGKPTQQQFSELEHGKEFSLDLNAGPSESEASNDFELDVVRRQFKYSYKGAPTMTFVALGDGYFDGAGPNKIQLKDGDVKVNDWLHFSGSTFILDTTKDRSTLTSSGAWANPDGKGLWAGPFNAKLTDQFEADLADGPVAMAAEWFVAGFSVSLEDLKFVGGVDKATGVSMNVRILIPQLASGCGYVGEEQTSGFSVGGIKLNGVTIGNDGLSIQGIELQNIGASVLPGFCMKSFKVNYDTPKKKLDVEVIGALKPIFDDFGGSFTAIDGKIDSYKVICKYGEQAAIPIPDPPPPAHVAVWKGLEINVGGLKTGPVSLKGTAFFSSRDDWKELPGFDELPAFIKKAALVELDGALDLIWGQKVGLSGKLNFLGYSSPWATSGAGAWLAQGTAQLDLQFGGTLSASGEYQLKILNVGGDNFFFNGAGKGSLTIFPQFNVNFGLSGTVLVPDVFKDIPLGDYINKKFGLPRTLSNATFRMNNLQFSAASTSSLGSYCYSIDLTKNPVTEPTQFFHMCNAASIIKGRAPEKRVHTLGAEDTTWFDFPMPPEMTLGVVHVYGDPLPVSILRDPTGAVRTIDANGPGVTYYPPGEAGESGMWEIGTPIAGDWSVGVIDMQQGDSIYSWGVYAPRPRFALQSHDDGRTVVATWPTTNVPDGSTIELYLDADSTGEDGVFIGKADEADGEFRYTMTDSLAECGYYVYGVRNDGGELQASYSPVFHPNPKSWLAPPTNVHAVGTSGTDHVTVSWDHSTDTTRNAYLVRVTDAQGHDSIYATTRFSFSMVDIDVPDWQHSTLSIRTAGEDGTTGCWSDPVSFEVADVETPQAEATTGGTLDMQIVPNPAIQTATVYINLEKADLLDIELYDITGKQVETLFVGPHPSGTLRAEFDVSDLPSGTYVMRVRTTHGTGSHTLVVTH